MDLSNFTASLGGVCLGAIFWFVFKLIRNRWKLVEIFIHPETGRCHEVKERNGNFRYYVNGFRVPRKVFEWL